MLTKFHEFIRSKTCLVNRYLYILRILLCILIVVSVFLASFAQYSSTNYQYTQVIRSLFDKQEQITNYKMFWNFIEGDLIDGLYWETWYNRGYRNAEVECPDGEIATKPCKVPPADRNIMYENRILGLPRIRMLKVTNTSCDVEPSFQGAIRKCYASYAQDHEDQQTTIPDFRKYSSENA